MRRLSTRFLLSLAAIAVAGGLVGIPNAYLFDALAVAAPAALGIATGFYVAPGMLAQAVFQRPGVGLLTQILAGLVAAAFVPTGILSVAAFALLGVLIELPYAILLYRYWRPWYAYLVGGFVAACYSVLWGIYYDTPALGPATSIGQPLVLLASMTFSTWIARLLAGRVQRTGVLRGLRPAQPRALGPAQR